MKRIPLTTWGKAPDSRAVLRAILTLVEDGVATPSDEEVFIPAAAVVSLSAEITDQLGLPPLAPLGLALALEGKVQTPEGRLRLRWADRSGVEVRPKRTGIVLQWGHQSGRLSAPLWRVAHAADEYNDTVGQPFEKRVTAWVPVQAALQRATGEEVHRDGFLETFTLYQAGSFALDVHEATDGVDFTPILMARDKAASLADDAPADEISPEGLVDTLGAADGEYPSDPLLAPADHRRFLDEAVRREGPTRDAYMVGKNRFVLIDPSLKRALDVVKAKRAAPEEERRTFLRNPRTAIAEALDPDSGDAPAALLFIETKNYSDRVEGLGLWERPNLPWLARPPNAWLPETGWVAGDKPVEPFPLSYAELEQLEREIEAAEIRGDAQVVIRGIPIPIDAAPQVLSDERQRTDRFPGSSPTPGAERAYSPEDKRTDRLVLIIKKTNFEGVDYELSLRRRPALIGATPPPERMGSTALKPHQVNGFQWLVEAWTAGWPGVLLADDMGLGKTFQALAFLAWLKSNAAAARARKIGTVAQGPILVVAPTALLKNWEKECADRLSAAGLGERLGAYGRDLASLKLAPSSRNDPGETLDGHRLRQADWILTTYETLTDHERVFARIPYSVVLFDEMQKIKAPDTLNTKAAKALNAEFVIGLTGTPIENRMEDLWCLFDRLAPGYLGDLKTFSRTFREDAPEKLSELKVKLDTPAETAPPVMMRRMKADILEGLPRKTEKKHAAPMQGEQASAYRDLIAEARTSSERSRGFMLSVLHGMRGISLHPHDPSRAEVSTASRFQAFAAQSARLKITLQILRGIAERHEKALVFIENIAMQDVVAEGIAAFFDLPRKPAIINGATPGEKRLSIVEAFQDANPGFGVLVLSPKAAGVGLNIVSANHVIHLSRWWNPAVEDQCNDRAYRIGQTKPVTVHLPIATHPDFPNESFDEVLDRLLERKRQLSRHMLAPPAGERDLQTLFEGAVPQR